MATIWHLDEGFHLDQEEEAVIEGEVEFTADTVYHHRPFEGLEMIIEVDLEIDLVHVVPLDLMPLVPEKFRESAILQAFISESGVQFGDFLTKVRDIVLLLSPNTVSSRQYLRYLGALIGVTFPPEDDSTEEEIRKILAQALDWYKLKGTYESTRIIAMAQSFGVNLFDMYTDDYSTFVLTDWFVGGENENPPRLGPAYYKSPHFGVEVRLNQTRVVGSQDYLWSGPWLDNFAQQIEDTRPVHTVPHYILLLNPKTDEYRNKIEVSGKIKTKITSDWQFSTKYFDMVGGGQAWSFDSSEMTFDSSEEAFIQSITKWTLGTGAAIDNSSGPAIQHPVLTGTIDVSDIVIDSEKYQFEFIVPKSVVQAGITELGLYIPGVAGVGDTLVLVSNFPKIDLDGRAEMRAAVQVFKSDLS